MGYRLANPEEVRAATTRAELLEAAGEVFAEVGYRAATVRQICERAGVNIASVNYHFGDKEQLYQAVLKDAYLAAVKEYPANFGLPARATPEQRLRAFVHSFLLRIFTEGAPARHGKLMAREMIEPTGALDVIVRENIQPLAALLREIVGDLLAPNRDEETLHLCALSVVSQVLFYHHCRPVIARMYPQMKFDLTGIEHLTDHITRFSLAAMREISKPA